MPYRQVDVRFWEDPEIQVLSPEDRDLLMYYMTNQHSNMLGLYRIPMAYVAEDRRRTIADCEQSTLRLTDAGLLEYDWDHQVVFLPIFLKSNKIVGTKQEKGAIARLILLPATPLLKDLKEAIKTFLPQRMSLLAAFDENHLPLRDKSLPETAKERPKNVRSTDKERTGTGTGTGTGEKTSRRKPSTGFTEKQKRMTSITEKYKKLKGIEPKGREWLPIQKTAKLMLDDGRTEQEIIACMEAIAKAAKSGTEWLQNWTMNTVRLKLPEFLSGVLALDSAGSVRDQQREERLVDLNRELESAAHVVTTTENRLAQLSWQTSVESAEEADLLNTRLAEFKKTVRGLRKKIKKEKQEVVE